MGKVALVIAGSIWLLVATAVGSTSDGTKASAATGVATAATESVSLGVGGGEAIGGASFDPVISADGRYVAYLSRASNETGRRALLARWLGS